MGVAFTFTVVLQNRKTDVDHATGLKRAPHSQGALVRVRVTTAARRAWELGRVGQVLFERLGDDNSLTDVDADGGPVLDEWFDGKRRRRTRRMRMRMRRSTMYQEAER
jgi:hypothetical protein